MNRIAKKRVLIVLAVGATLVGSAGGLYGYRKVRISRHFQSLRAEGMAAAAAGDFPLAVSDLQQYLGRFGNDAEALEAFCRVRPKVPSADRSHLRETMQALRYFVSLKPDAVAQRRELLDLYLTYNLNTEALDAADRLLPSHPDDVELLAAKTKALARLRRPGEALAVAEKWAAVAPPESEAQQYRIELMKLSGKDDASIKKEADALLAAHPQSMRVRIVRGQALLQAGDVTAARAIFTEAASIPDATADELRSLATIMDQVGLYDDSTKLLARLVAATEAGAADAKVNQVYLAQRLWERGDDAGFLAFVDKHPDVLADEPGLVAIRGLLLKASGKAGEGDAEIAKLDAPGATPAAKAWAAIARASAESPTVAETKRQIELISDALVDRPSDAYLLYFLGQAYASSGDQELAISIWQRSTRAAPAWAIPPRRASEVLLAQNRYQEAFDLAAAAAARSSALGLATYIRVWTAAVEAGQRADEGDLLNVIDQVIPQAPGEGWLRVAKATVLCRLGRAEEARKFVLDSLADDKAKFDQRSLLQLSELSRAKKLNVDAEVELKLRGNFGVTAEGATTAFLRKFLASGDKAAALSEFEAARAASPSPDGREWQLADARIRDFLRDAKARDAWTRLLASNGDDLEVIQSAVASSSLWADRATVDGLIEMVRQLSGDRGMSWRLLRARWLLEGSTDEAPDVAAAQKASDLLTALLLSTPENVAAHFWQARAQLRLGNRGSAIDHLMTATKLAPRSAPIALYAARLLQEQGDFVRAREQLERMTSQDLSDPEQNALAAQLLAQQGKASQAIELLEQSRSLGASEQSDLLLAILYQRQGAYEKTEAIISRLMQQPTLATITFAADFYRARGKADVADQTLNKLYSLQLAPGVREMTLADYNLRKGDLDQAEKLGEAATVASPQNVAAWRGLIIAQLAAGHNEAATATLGKARQAIPADAYLNDLASGETWPLIAAANDELLKPLSIRLTADPKDQPARRALALIRDSKGKPAAELINGLQQLAAQFPLSQPLQIVAAQVLLNAGQSEQAAALAAKGVQTFPTDDALPRLAAQALLNAGQWSQARSFAQAWRQQAGADVLAPDLLAAIAALQMGSPADAESLLRAHVPYAMDRLERNGDVVRTFAIALYQQGKSAEGEKVVEQAIARRPAFATEWVAAASTGLPAPDAARWFERIDPQLADVAAKTAAARYLLQLALRPDAGPDVMQKLKARLASLESQSDLDVGSISVLGVIADQIGDREQAERLYRRVGEDGKPHAVVWNNLAMLLLNAGRQLDEADALAAKAVAAEPLAAVYLDTHAQVLLAKKQADAARAEIDRALKLEPNNPQWQLTSAEVFFAAGQATQARAVVDNLLASAAARNALGADVKRAETLRDRLGSGADGGPR